MKKSEDRAATRVSAAGRWTFLASALLIGLRTTVAHSNFSREESAYFLSSPAISIGFSVPPARVTIVDSAGRLTGVDPASPISAVGEGVELAQIPYSQTFSMNTSNDDGPNLGAQNSQTDWGCDIATRTDQIYEIRVLGINDGVETLRLVAGGARGWVQDPISPLADHRLLVSPGKVRKLTVHFDPVGRSVVLSRVVAPQDLSDDVATACRLNLITPDGICRSLTAKAVSAKAALSRGKKRTAANQIQSFINELNAQDSQHVLDPASFILRDEAQTLLKSLK